MKDYKNYVYEVDRNGSVDWWKVIAVLFYIIFIIVLLCGCESKRAAKKISWLKDRGYLQADTIRDTLRGFQVDTFVRFDTLNHVDTLTVEKKRG